MKKVTLLILVLAALVSCNQTESLVSVQFPENHPIVEPQCTRCFDSEEHYNQWKEDCWFWLDKAENAVDSVDVVAMNIMVCNCN
jgi:hypothetical protein